MPAPFLAWCDPNSMPIPRPVSPCCSPNFVGAHVRDFPYSSRLLPSHSSPLSSPRRMEAPASPLPTFAEW
ncbi:hypothetical protein DUNSADRAFT_5508 [Dunaliella salina]|uniref:Encoded protein n=1 Tax=Dunaliella salina TaxID=3046 RepID=A0ABQ7H7A6_DUNSA|nr:hypothetical protein DUNSADRAFT_5508 [Dunaliella salina]|eukprot:KAF5842741.1 hypothetical protein DUNSADRAFT_5508 [Dunaliella salina]